MKIFKSIADLNQLDSSYPAYTIVKQHLVRMGDLYPGNGYLVLVDSLNDFDQGLKLPEVKRSWGDIVHLSEGCVKQDGYYKLFYATNNSFGICLFIQNADWLDDSLRKALEEHLI